MARPAEYENLLRIGAFKDAASSPDSIAQFLNTAQEFSASAKMVQAQSVRFALAYEGTFSVVMAVLEYYGVRPGDGGGHRTTAIARVAADLKLDAAKQSVLYRLHDARNRVTYRAPIPPITAADAMAMQTILDDVLAAAQNLIGLK
jgi:hypothetical protein